MGAWLAGVATIARREAGASLDSGIAFVVVVALGVLVNSIFMNEFFLVGLVDMQAYFDLLPPLCAFFLPAISMRLWAEEKKTRTVEFLLTLPLVPGQAVLGKYLAALGLYSLFLASSLPIVVMLEVLGSPDRGLIVCGYLAAFLFGALLLALGSLWSALTQDQIVAFVASALSGYALVVLGDEQVVAILDGLWPALSGGSFLRDHLSLLPHYQALAGGLLEVSTLAYFLGLSAVFLWTSAVVLKEVRE